MKRYMVSTEDSYRCFRWLWSAQRFLCAIPLEPGQAAVLSKLQRNGVIRVFAERYERTLRVGSPPVSDELRGAVAMAVGSDKPADDRAVRNHLEHQLELYCRKLVHLRWLQGEIERCVAEESDCAKLGKGHRSQLLTIEDERQALERWSEEVTLD